MAKMKIYYSVDTTTKGYPIHFTELTGQHVRLENNYSDPGEAIREFKAGNPGAVFLKWDDFCKRLALIAAEREKLASWNAGYGL